ncbi:alpha/beta-hydrolase [Aulographum hederae CBS 113979]|uniref:Alpha/beta-hydrolase n=1 Tax=Aulographum hederae CBS 113979 TaxID=1176131 RepID=A0A6G1H5V4_9PEZI|nr:alpha/beta-hydrolase [Aulographum hederae CBS 113979]
MVKEEVLDLGKFDPEFEHALDITDPSMLDIGKIDIYMLRGMMAEMKKAVPRSLPPPGVLEQDIQIPTRGGAEITLRIYTPEKRPADGCPIYVNYHGGGFLLGDLESDEIYCRNYVKEQGFVVVSVDYRLAPEHKFPTPVHDAYDALKWVAANFTTSLLHGNPAKGFLIGGASAGGNLSAVCAHLARDEALQPALTGVHLMIPSLFAPSACPPQHAHKLRSIDQCADNPVLSLATMKNFKRHYAADLDSHLFSVIKWPGGHGGLPPHYFQVCGADMLRDEALVYETVLREEWGVQTQLKVYPGMPHGFWAVWPDMVASRRFVREMGEGVEWLRGFAEESGEEEVEEMQETASADVEKAVHPALVAAADVKGKKMNEWNLLSHPFFLAFC